MISIWIILLSAAALAADLRVAYNPSIVHKLLSAEELSQLARATSAAGTTTEWVAVDVPADTREYDKQSIFLGKNFLPAFAAVDASLGLVNTSEFLELRQLRPDLRVVAGFTESGRAGKGTCALDAQLVVLQKSPLKRASDLRGKRIGVVRPEQSHLFAGKAWLQEHRTAGFTLVPLNSAVELRSSLAEGAIDAALDPHYHLGELDLTAGFFKRELHKEFGATEIHHRALLSSRHRFPCSVVYAHRSVSDQVAGAFVERLRGVQRDAATQHLLPLTHISPMPDQKNVDKMVGAMNFPLNELWGAP